MKGKVIAAWFALLGCGLACSEEQAPRGPNPNEVPEMVSLHGGSVTAGFAIGKSRDPKTFTSFRVTTSPITVAQYRQCMSVGACTLPAPETPSCDKNAPFSSSTTSIDGRTYGIDDALPMTCLAPNQAIAYCRGQGGTLPTLTQWTAAARGNSVHRYAWGDGPATCDEHPGAGHDGKKPCTSDLAAFRVGTHPSGASPSGMQDVLLTRAELLNTSDDAQFPSCRGTGTCAVQGVFPGTIDSVRPVYSPRDVGASFGFRCVVQGGDR